MEEQKKIMEGFLGQRMIVLTPNIRKEIKENPLISSFYLTALGYYPHADGHECERPRGASEFILLYCIDGEGEIEMNDEVYLLKANTFFIIPKNTPHRYYSSDKAPWSIYWLHFSGTNSRKLYERSLIDGAFHVHSIPFEQYRIKSFDQIFNTLDRSFSSRDMEIMNFRSLYFLTSFIYYRDINPAVYSIDMVSNSIAYMKINLDKKLSINALADEQNLSISHYLRSFKAKTGQSPIAYLNQLKIQQSCQYLYFTDKSIKEICALLGIDDQYYFSRLFTKLIGTSPSAYRKAYKR
ncbi:AraC family transcriptional regulator [Pedobacter hiemivivus]|uniref:AraC family transcriptional regulator n=1 Tax=Pedobacter hiemivivus TaxID=2530454 RepID=A0A4R0MIG3_9SPHI|nr:AraC family transcriptional regulator [Pedobacter hiemivivus]TCC86340.1 AraC family transcriptional regulator [Pedobacter hiemivivus]TKC58152.1 AraC family transcriptional regulator [Pedobacter hiemivivus]